jgi:sugar (pentulose or hexulose) kinase
VSVLAIDAGTTGVTAVVVEPDGTIAAKGHEEFAQHFPKRPKGPAGQARTCCARSGCSRR